MQTSSTKKPIPAFILSYSDSGFTNPHEMVLPDEPHDCRGKHTHMGAQYWGLETQRHQATTAAADKKVLYFDHEAFNWVRIALKQRTTISEISFSTKWFTGNQVQAISATLIDEMTRSEMKVIDRAKLQPDAEHRLKIEPTLATECYLQLYYEGGLSRVCFFGEAAEEQPAAQLNLLKKAAISHVSNSHYGGPALAVAGEREVMHMSGWESARTGFGERALFTLDRPVQVQRIVVDTYLHRLNSPLTCHIFGLLEEDLSQIEQHMAQAPRWQLEFADGQQLIPDNFQSYMLEQRYLAEPVSQPTQFKIKLHHPPESSWQPLLPFARLEADCYHRFDEFESNAAISHLLYMHYPNGGIHGLKLFGRELS